MLFRAVFYGVDRSISLEWVNTDILEGYWFKHKKRSYRLDREAICQVMEKGNRIKGTVEALYIEGFPLPLRSNLNVKTVTQEHLKETMSKAGNKPVKSFWDRIRGR